MDDDQNFLNEVFSKPKGASKQDGGKKEVITSRKAVRKQQRKDKKQNKHAYLMKYKKGTINVKLQPKTESATQEEDADNPAKKPKKRHRKSKKSQQKDNDEIGVGGGEEQSLEEFRNESLRAANVREEKNISQLEKLLGLKKKKKTGKISAAFLDDGLDYLLEVCEPSSKKVRHDCDESDDDGHVETELDRFVKEKRAKQKERKELSQLSLDVDVVESNVSDGEADVTDGQSSEEESDEEMFDDDDNDDDDGGVEEGTEQAEVVIHKSDCGDQAVTKETDRSSATASSAKYIPPTLRRKSNNAKSLAQTHLLKQMKGLLNRLSEANLIGISREVAGIFSKNSHNECNETLTKLITDACVLPTLMPEKMVIDYIMLIVVLHAHVGTDVGSYFLEVLAQSFSKLHSAQLEDTKECDNVVLLVVLLYKFKVVQSLLVFDIVHLLIKSFTERDVELILLILKTVGFDIRKDNPSALQEIIKQVQDQAAAHKDTANKSRVKFMLEVINAIKNNNTKKVPQYDPSLHSHAQKLLKQIVTAKDTIGDMELHVSLDDLCNAKQKGRWWIVGSAWSGRDADISRMSSCASQTQGDSQEDSKILDLAKKHRMNTDVRRQMFCSVMTSEDYLDAFEKLIKLNVKGKVSRDMVYVVMDCCLREKSYNQYYGYLTQKLCEFNRGNQVTFQYLTWDRLKQLGDLQSHSRKNLAQLAVHLFTSNAVSISILKVVSFASLDTTATTFFAYLFKCLLKYPEATVKSTFGRVSSLPKLVLLREGIKVFLLKNLWPKETPEVNMADVRMKELIQIAEAALDGRQYVPL